MYDMAHAQHSFTNLFWSAQNYCRIAIVPEPTHCLAHGSASETVLAGFEPAITADLVIQSKSNPLMLSLSKPRTK